MKKQTKKAVVKKSVKKEVKKGVPVERFYYNNFYNSVNSVVWPIGETSDSLEKARERAEYRGRISDHYIYTIKHNRNGAEIIDLIKSAPKKPNLLKNLNAANKRASEFLAKNPVKKAVKVKTKKKR